MNKNHPDLEALRRDNDTLRQRVAELEQALAEEQEQGRQKLAQMQLLGARVMLTGIQPGIAQTIVHLGVDLSGITTHGSLQAGIAAALGS